MHGAAFLALALLILPVTAHQAKAQAWLAETAPTLPGTGTAWGYTAFAAATPPSTLDSRTPPVIFHPDSFAILTFKPQ